MMEPLFTSEYTVNEKDNAELQKFAALHADKGALAFLAAFPAAMLVLAVLLLPASAGWFFLLIAALFPAYYALAVFKKIKGNKEAFGKKLRYFFYEDGWTVTSDETVSPQLLGYDRVKLFEREDRFYLVYYGRTGFIIKKDGFEKGAPEDFAAAMKEKLGKRYKPESK